MLATVQQFTPPRPFLKWAGGKSQLIQQYRSHFAQRYTTYYEPFLGGGAVFFCLLPERAVLTDINPELVNVYRCLQNSVEDVIDLLETHQRSHSFDYYYAMRSTCGTTNSEKAARFIYLNRTCFNGLYRENSKGEFNVPMGRYKAPKVSNPDLLRSVAHALRNADIAERSFDAVLQQAAGPDDFVYFDPPYYPISLTSRFTAYSRYSFGPTEQIRLRDTFAELAGRGVQVMLSNSDCPFIRDLYQDFRIHTISATRSINSDPQKRGKITEVLVTSLKD